MVRTRAGFAVCSYGVGPRILVRSSSRAGLLAGSERSGIGGLPHVAGVRRENVGYRVYTAQGNLERINEALIGNGNGLTAAYGNAKAKRDRKWGEDRFTE